MKSMKRHLKTFMTRTLFCISNIMFSNYDRILEIVFICLRLSAAMIAVE